MDTQRDTESQTPLTHTSATAAGVSNKTTASNSESTF